MGIIFAAQDVNIGVLVHAPHAYKDDSTNEVYGPGIDYISAIVKDM